MNRKYILTIALLVVFIDGFCQTSKIQLKNFSTFNGLSQSSVIAIHQDTFGQMWFGTRDGLNKYDGTNFTVFRNNPSDSLSISNNDILSIEEDAKGNIWVGTYNGLNCFNPISNTFKQYFHANNKHTINNNTIWCVKEIENEIWVGTSNGLSIINKDKNKVLNVLSSSSVENSLTDNYVLSILHLKNGNIFIGTAKGICKLIDRKNDKFNFQQIALNNTTESFFVQDIVEDVKGNLWVGTKSNGLLYYNTTLNKFTSYLTKIKDVDVRSLTIDKNGTLWVGTYSGVCTIDKSGTVQTVTSKHHESLDLVKIKSIFTDKKGSVWIGTYYKGVNFWDISNVNFSNINEDSGEMALGFDVISSIEKEGENIYFGTEGGGITIINTKNNNASYINTDNATGLTSDNVKSLCLTNNELLWIGTFTGGISVYNIKTQKFENHRISKTLQELLKQAGVYSIKKGENNYLWLGTFGKGLIKYNTKSKLFEEVGIQNNSDNTLSNKRVRTILIDKNNNIWVGTQSGLNLLKVSKSNKNNYNLIHFFFDKEVVSGDDIFSVFEDSKGKIWVGTKAKGVFLFNGKSFDKVNINDENSNIISIHAIEEDSENNFWLSSNQGIIQYNPSTKKTIIYDQKDGLASNEFNDNASLKAANDRFYFGGPAGFSFFDAKKIAVNTYSPQVLLTNFFVKNELVNVSDSQNILNKTINYTKSLILSYDKANFSINFSIPNFVNSNNNQYAYRLVGLQNEWVTTTNTEANYTIQNAGTYIFEVKGANNDGIWNSIPTTLKIIVKPAPWKSGWAFALYTLLILLSLYGLAWIMKSKAKLKHELELEHIETKRSEEINNSKLQFFTNISHEFRTPLTLILGPLQQILSNYNGSNSMHKKLLVIEGSANHLLQLINRLMDFRKLENNQYTLETAEGNIVKFLHEIFLSFSEFAKDSGYTYTFNSTDDEILVYYDRYKLERVFYNLISNAFRYTPEGGIINFNVFKHNDEICIEVEDTGVGIADEYIDKIFDRFFEIAIHNHPQKSYNKGTGIGLSIAKNIVKLHKGTINVKNKKTKGVIFKVTLPLGKEHLSENEILNNFKISDDVTQYTSQLSVPEIVIDGDVSDFEINQEKFTILLVEDNKPLRSFMKNLLKKEYNILEAENGKIAMKKALKFVPDLIISDVIMPEMVGTELCAAIKENLKTSHIPVILLTSRTSLIYKVEGLESGADDYISKPFNLKEFKLRIKNLLDSTQRLKNKFSSQDTLTPSEITVSSLDEELLKKAFKIVENNISNELFDIPLFCEELGVSRTLLFTKIKAWTNFTPNEFIQEFRLKRAAQLLEQNKINVSQVCFKVGFKNPKYFSKCFQKKYGLTPTQYTNKFTNQILE